MAIVSKEVFDEGKAAKAAGKDDGANPYEAGSQESLDWLEGFTDGQPTPDAIEPDA